MSNAAHIQTLRDALAASPTNVPLRTLVAESLASAGRLDEATATLKEGLARSPNDSRLTIGLAKVYLADGKYSAGLVLCEGVLGDDSPAELYMAYGRLLLRSGEPERAADAYRSGLAADPAAADAELAAQLGVADEEDRVPVPAGPLDSDTGGEVERPRVTFADVGGMESVKEAVRLKIIHPLTHADLYKAYGQKAGGGLLLYGPPGCGKTHLARATAGEVKAGFLAVGLHDVLNMWMGNSEKNLHALFEQARRSKPCVLFFDEVDALAASRTDFRQSSARHVINQFLSELDGMSGSNDGVLVLAATNAPWHMDSAFRRPGRFDRVLFVPPPDGTARTAILRLHTAGKPLAEVDFAAVSRATADFSGADLKAVVDRAVEAKLAEAVRTGVPKPLTTADLLSAAKGLKPTTREWFADARNYALYANDGGQYDELADHLKLR